VERAHELQRLPLGVKLQILIDQHLNVVLNLLKVVAIVMKKQESLVLVLELKDTHGHLLEAVGRSLSDLEAPDVLWFLVHFAKGKLSGELRACIVD
jgi:hypothetical protein